ncbi:uncharacterized protein LOC121399966 [Xenopus laevis]|uniref:Uncharacterized protein LOC121399966 n=1 Tax=Xenopus laevis TaxID=8355 RepID=A0A8J1M8B3_XENLA|nr:uncharacterized protein LOC121399966 [Xenopus laevis]
MGTLQPETVLCGIDIQSLYTSIPHNEGLDCIEEVLLDTNLSTSKIYFIMDCLNMVLTKNYFSFEDNFYWQTQGTSMGATVAPSYANLFVNHLEKKIFLKKEPFCQHILAYLRFVDDILLLWTGPVELLKQMIDEANESHSTIKFTYEYSFSEINFLDVTISLTNGIINTDLYRKSVEKNNMLHVRSFHSPKVKKAIPKGQFIRAKRITSRTAKYNEVKLSLTKQFKERGYESNTINNAMKEVDTIPRSELLCQKKKECSNQKIAFVSTFNSNSNKMENIIKKYWPLIQADRQFGHLFTEQPRFCYKRGRSLKDILYPSDTRQKKSLFQGRKKKGTYPYLSCNCCSSIIKGSKINHPSKGYEINLNVYATCKSTHMVYLLKCPCGLGYVGQTSREVKMRIQEHKRNIKNFKENTQTDTSISKHFFICKHNLMQLR